MTDKIDAVFRIMFDLTMNPFQIFTAPTDATRETVAATFVVARVEPELVAGTGWCACDIFADTGADDHELPFPEEDDESPESLETVKAEGPNHLGYGSFEKRAGRMWSDSLAAAVGVAL